MTAFGRERYDLDIHQALLEEVELLPESYDVVTLWGTDSQFLHPREGFAKLSRCLAPGGVFAMTYQDFTHWIRRLFPGIKRNWNALFLLSEKSVRVLFEQIDFDIAYHALEWQSTTVDHISRIVKLPVPRYFGQFATRVPAVSFPIVIARKRARR